ncbi:ABC transporter ATP-binding protein [Paenibacillus sp. UMB4589-SE434]|uniref:ABC transporter ATP-binding protein n=1 Tax=Paenibacillus sp. UMB4589-SE434 TaxID=3046314 RepID=UPI00254C8F83|nr:ABC transporter ATP-binding protein [Paenibacillus sp. UMB4589-SE434]MDK8179705.1 ABC transporter ATP-binding protein [Paenibacillus sp. UMB4589-SE434]
METEHALPDRPVILSVKQIKKKIGRKWIIHDVSFDVRAGEIFGFLGPNGSGKTTTIRMLVDLIKPTSGHIQVCGYDVNRQPEKALRFVGSIVENPEMYNYLTGWENLEHFARMVPGIDSIRIHEVVNVVGLTKRIHDKVKTYSLGMRQRLGIAQALLVQPKLLILDEPTNGLDPLGIKELRGFIRLLADSGMAVFVSSHLLSEIQLMCDRVAIISNGCVLAVDDVDQLLTGRSQYVIWMAEPLDKALQMLQASEQAKVLEADKAVIDESVLIGLPEHFIITETSPEHIAALNQALTDAGVAVEGIQRVVPTLEQLFLEMTEGGHIE